MRTLNEEKLRILNNVEQAIDWVDNKEFRIELTQFFLGKPVKGITQFYEDIDYRRVMKSQWNDGYSAGIENARLCLDLSSEQVEDLMGELANVEE
jgi:hypothetical protein